jgi:alpha-mannosidase
MANRGFAMTHSEKSTIPASPRHLENPHLRVDVQADATIQLFDKATGNQFQGLLMFEDGGDMGDGWIMTSPSHNQIFQHSGYPVSTSLETLTELEARLKITLSWSLPEAFNLALEKRSERTTELPMTLELRLEPNSRYLDVSIRNTVRDHRLRLLFPSDTTAETYQSDTVFLVNDRPLMVEPKPDYAPPHIPHDQ